MSFWLTYWELNVGGHDYKFKPNEEDIRAYDEYKRSCLREHSNFDKIVFTSTNTDFLVELYHENTKIYQYRIGEGGRIPPLFNYTYDYAFEREVVKPSMFKTCSLNIHIVSQD